MAKLIPGFDQEDGLRDTHCCGLCGPSWLGQLAWLQFWGWRHIADTRVWKKRGPRRPPW
jgi:hypothetical protein